MPILRLETFVRAPQQICFDLARDVDAHVRSTSRTEERAVAGVTSGRLGLGDEVTWEAKHFGIRQRLTSRITRFEPPTLFVDEMVRGAFASFTHLHEFEPIEGGTLMRDVFDYRSPLGALGRLADAWFLERYMRRFLETRAAVLKEIAETSPAP